MSKTAQRRHQHQRHMRRRLRTPHWSWVETSPMLTDTDRAALRNRAARHTVMCSCPGCGHRRELEGPTVQERRATQPVDWGDGDVTTEYLYVDYDDWTDEDWLAMGLILMGQMYEREEMNCGHHGNS